MEANSPPLLFSPAAGESIGKYEVLELMGEGTYGRVYKVRSRSIGVYYALKLLKLWEIDNQTQQQKIIKRFDGEYKCGKIPSKYLVHSIEKGVAFGNPYIVMEFIDNGDLRTRRSDFYSIHAINNLAVQILLGLKDLHKNGVIHRDVKPENVMLDKYNNAKLTDFGIAGFLNSRLTVPNFFNGKVQETFGTYAYIAPEQLMDKMKFESTSSRTDIFSFGVMMYEILSGGKYPFGELNNHAQLANYIKNASEGNYSNLSLYRPDIPSYWNEVISVCLEPRFERRAKTVDQILSLIPGNTSVEIESEPYDFENDELVLVVTQGEQTGREYPISRMLQHPDGLLKIGWFDPNAPYRNDIEIVENATAFVSNFHATIERNWKQRKWFIRDGQFRKIDGRWGWYFSKNGGGSQS